MVTSPQVMKNLSESVQKMQKQHQKKPRSHHHQTPAAATPKGGTTPAAAGGGGTGSANHHHKKAHHHQPSPASKKSLSFATPTKAPPATPSNRSSATPSPRSCYAGSKCYEPPTPESLPKPPPAWTGPGGCQAKLQMQQSPLQALVSSMQRQEQRQMDSRDSNEAVSQHLKLLLKVNA